MLAAILAWSRAMLGPPLDRRGFLCSAGLGAAAAMLPWPSRGETALVARRVFFENPEYRNVRLSPDGKHLAYLAPLDGVRNLWVAAIDAPKDAQPLTRAADRDIGWEYRWAHTNWFSSAAMRATRTGAPPVLVAAMDAEENQLVCAQRYSQPISRSAARVSGCASLGASIAATQRLRTPSSGAR